MLLLIPMLEWEALPYLTGLWQMLNVYSSSGILVVVCHSGWQNVGECKPITHAVVEGFYDVCSTWSASDAAAGRAYNQRV